MTTDELTVLMIAVGGESMIPIGRWEAPIRALTERGLLRALDAVNFVITDAGRAAVKAEEKEADQAFTKAILARNQSPETYGVDMTVNGRQIDFDLYFDPNFMADVCTRQFLQHNGACEPELVHLMRRVIRPGDFVIDGGANIGFFTLVASRLVGEEGHVEAFEPATVNFKKLRKNLDLNRVENVTAVNRALWSDDTEQMLYLAQDTGLCSLMPFESAITSLPVRGLTLDGWCLNYEHSPRLIKLDLEGAEEHALIGARALLEEGVDFVVCELNMRALHNFGSSQANLRKYMKAKGYEMFWLHEDGSEPTLVDDGHVLEGAENLNALFSEPEIVRKAWEAELT